MILKAMDAHPIPQNVTSFQFKLVGEMTLKQFMYLATGMLIAYVFFVFLASRIPFIAWPVIILSASTGAAFAFLPIGDRPLDHWLGAFLKAVYSPTKMIWKKEGNVYNQDTYFNNRLQVYLKNITPNLKVGKTTLPPATQRSNQPIFKTEVVDTPTVSQPQPITPVVSSPMITSNQTASVNLPTKDELAQTVELAKQAQSIQVQIIQSQRQLNDLKNTAQNPSAYQQVNQLLTNLQSLVNEASGIKQKLDSLTHAPQTPKVRAKVTTITPAKSKPTQIILTTTPNVINGFVTDAQGNYLTSAVVVIYDKQGLPVRALKTNKLGQFSGATPLPNGTYTIQLEKDSLVFDVLQVDLTGEVLPALTIAAKKVL